MIFMTVENVQIPDSLSFLLVGIVLLIAFGIFDFLSKRIKKKKNKTALEGLERGNKVVMINGMTGTVASIYDDIIEVDVSASSRARFMKWAVSEIEGKKIL